MPVNPFDNALAVDQMEVAYSTLLARSPASEKSESASVTQKFAKDGKRHPRIVRYNFYLLASVSTGRRSMLYKT